MKTTSTIKLLGFAMVIVGSIGFFAYRPATPAWPFVLFGFGFWFSTIPATPRP